MLSNQKNIPKVWYPPKSGNLESGATSENVTDADISEKVEGVMDTVWSAGADGTGLGAVAEISGLLKQNGILSLKAYRDGNVDMLSRPEILSALEVIVRLDGTRPTYLVKDGSVDLSSAASSPYWENMLHVSSAPLRRVIPSVGRINLTSDYLPFAGTGFLIHENLLLTNRHVLQAIAFRNLPEQKWVVDASASVDFMAEHKSDGASVRKISRVAFAGATPIPTIDHALQDIAILELEPTDEYVGDTMKLSSRIPAVGDHLYTIGFPAMPRIGDYPLTLLEQLFQGSFGCKRLAPGIVLDRTADLPEWTFIHDATTLGGNSGSLVLLVDDEKYAVGLHYGGRNIVPKANFAHRISEMTVRDGFTGMSFRETLDRYNLTFEI